MKKIQVIGYKDPSNILMEEALKYLNEESSKEKYLFHKSLPYLSVYKEKIEGKTYYIKVSKPKTVSRGIKKRIGVKLPRATKYYELSKKLEALGINIVAPEYVFVDKSKMVFRKNVSFSWDFKERYGIEGEYHLITLLEENIDDEKVVDKWIYKYLDIILKMIKSYYYHQDPNFYNFFYNKNEIHMIDLDDIKESKNKNTERLETVRKKVKKNLEGLGLSNEKLKEYFHYFDDNIKK
ncbi:hypothetical protein PM10SUCC1_06800 [Propionigenium maris DSM 9537]|uniref:Lipopolysaccharide kinase (Kdo/WaaP) family protein n=1 Tax=Propionigenium maris DSM 9537 TaxID=1123000 RepID=A0A9W6GJ86_9FUSO|nr:hypothetical protein [Propionigenium maris]GLI55165.1 hypothetical protein PM10SUCC1_06800 [Propionigenium maris DSM 9537]